MGGASQPGKHPLTLSTPTMVLPAGCPQAVWAASDRLQLAQQQAAVLLTKWPPCQTGMSSGHSQIFLSALFSECLPLPCGPKRTHSLTAG